MDMDTNKESNMGEAENFNGVIMPEVPENQMKNSTENAHTKAGLWTSIVIIALVVVIGGIVYLYSNNNRGQEIIDAGEGRELTRMTNGEIVDGFPNELMFEGTGFIKVLDSFKINYKNEGISQPVVQYASSESLINNIIAVRKGLVVGGWSITKEADPEEGSVTNFHATRGKESTNITFSYQGQQTVLITVAYTLNK